MKGTRSEINERERNLRLFVVLYSDHYVIRNKVGLLGQWNGRRKSGLVSSVRPSVSQPGQINPRRVDIELRSNPTGVSF